MIHTRCTCTAITLWCCPGTVSRQAAVPWWFDSLEVQNGESFDVAFVADNPGLWMDHCHNLKHAREGLVTHLMYDGVTTPYRLGDETGNTPE